MKAVFVFSHPMAFRAWDAACGRLQEQGIEAVVVSQMSTVDWNDFAAREVREADAVYLELSRHFPSFETLVQSAQKARVVVTSGVETEAELPARDPGMREMIDRYLKAGGVDDLVNAAKFLLYRAGCLKEAPGLPAKALLCGVLDLDSNRLFDSATDYFAYQTCAGKEINNKPISALCFGRSLWLDGDLALPRAAVQALEERGFFALPIFCDWDLATTFGRTSEHPLDRIFEQCGDRLTSIWNGLFSHPGQTDDSGSPFVKYDVPVFQLLRHWAQTAEKWQAGSEGLSAMTICYGLTQPEMLGCIEPTLVACNRVSETIRVKGTVNQADVVTERVQRLADRNVRWHRLRSKPRSEKRVAILLHSSPCKSVEATLTYAAGLDAAESAVQLLRLLADSGYKVYDVPQNGEELIALFLKRKAIHEFRWTNVEQIVNKKGVLAVVDRESYLKDFSKLEPETQESINRAWGDFPGEAMVHRDDFKGESLIVTGLRFGNVLVMVEPKRGCYGPKCDGEVCRILHEPDIAPTHHFLATYFYLQHQVDAIVTMGAESPVEYLPGKRAGLSGRCFPEIALGDLPVIYPYIMTATAEGLMAKRRARAVLVDHLSPPISKVGEHSKRLDEIEELYRQYRAAETVNDKVRLQQVSVSLRWAMQEANLLEPDADSEAFCLVLDSLARRLSAIRNRTQQLAPHVLGNAPSPAEQALYIEEVKRGVEQNWSDIAFKAALAKTDSELGNTLLSLDGRFIKPGPSGHLSRGKIEVVPTGRNFYGLDLKCVPTRAAFEVGREMGEQLLRKYRREEGHFPQTIGIVLWSSDAFRAEGELVGQVLWLLGCMPRWKTGGRVDGVDLLHPSAFCLIDGKGERITRPRIDVVVQMSGVVRDTLPMLYEMIDKAVSQVADLDEPADVNFVRAHVDQRIDELKKTINVQDAKTLKRLSTMRLFSSKPGSFGVGVNLALDASAWEDDADLAEAFVNWTGIGYGKGIQQSSAAFEDASMTHYAQLIKSLDIAYQKASAAEYDALSIGCYSGFQGGMAAAKRGLGGGGTKLYWGDSVSCANPEVRDLSEEIELCFTAKLLNPDWIDLQKRQAYRGASTVSTMVNTAFAWSATSRVITKAQFDGICRVYIENKENREWLTRDNLYALEEITRRLLEAHSRGLWQADPDQIEAVQQTVLSLEGDLEDQMGPVSGEFQGGSVDILVRDRVEAWNYRYRVK